MLVKLVCLSRRHARATSFSCFVIMIAAAAFESIDQSSTGLFALTCEVDDGVDTCFAILKVVVLYWAREVQATTDIIIHRKEQHRNTAVMMSR